MYSKKREINAHNVLLIKNGHTYIKIKEFFINDINTNKGS